MARPKKIVNMSPAEIKTSIKALKDQIKASGNSLLPFKEAVKLAEKEHATAKKAADAAVATATKALDAARKEADKAIAKTSKAVDAAKAKLAKFTGAQAAGEAKLTAKIEELSAIGTTD